MLMTNKTRQLTSTGIFMLVTKLTLALKIASDRISKEGGSSWKNVNVHEQISQEEHLDVCRVGSFQTESETVRVTRDRKFCSNMFAAWNIKKAVEQSRLFLGRKSRPTCRMVACGGENYCLKH